MKKLVILIMLFVCSVGFAKTSYVWRMYGRVIALGPNLELKNLSVGDHELILRVTSDPNDIYLSEYHGVVTVGNDPNGHSMKWNKRIDYRKPTK